MVKHIHALFLTVVALALISSHVEAKEVRWQGTVTAVDSNANKEGRSFTAVSKDGQVKMFYIQSLKHLDIGDRVVLSYIDANRFPLNVTTVKFLPPKR